MSRELISIIVLIFSVSSLYAKEEVKLISYYPSPSGNYIQLKVGQQDTTTTPTTDHFLTISYDSANTRHLISGSGIDNIEISHDGTASSLSVEETNGYVGIGTGNPSENLEIYGTSNPTMAITEYNTPANADTPTLALKRASLSGSNPGNTYSGHLLGKISFIGYDGSNWQEASNIYSVARDNYSSSANNVEADIFFQVNDGSGLETAMTIEDSGEIGIGTENPDVPLHIYKAHDDFTGIKIENPNTESNSKEGVIFADENGTLAYIYCFDDENESYPSLMAIGNARPGGDIMIMAKDSLTIDTDATSGGDITITANNDLNLIATNGYINLGTSVSYSSSQTLKQDIVPFSISDYKDMLNKLNEIEVVRYRFKTDPDDSRMRIGLIAENSPSEITDEKNTAIDIPKTIGFILAILKAQEEEIKKLKEELARTSSTH